MLRWILALAITSRLVACLALDEAFLASPSWTELPKGSTPRFAHAAVWDPVDEMVLVFGGEGHKGDSFELYDDLWEFAPKSKSWKKIESAGGPPRRAYHAMTWDPTRKVLWLFGGAGDGFQPFDDLWCFDPKDKKWTAIAPAGAKPGARFDPAFHYDAKHDRLVLAGGCKKFFEAANAWEDVWLFDCAKREWTSRKTPGRGRWQAASALDADHGLLVIHGGFDGNSTVRGETLLYDLEGDKWSEPAAKGAGDSPKSTDAHAAAWDPLAGQMLVYGGATPAAKGREELWAFNPTSKLWRKLGAGTPGPGPRAYHSAVFAPAMKSLYVFGGTKNQFNDPVLSPEVWGVRLHK